MPDEMHGTYGMPHSTEVVLNCNKISRDFCVHVKNCKMVPPNSCCLICVICKHELLNYQYLIEAILEVLSSSKIIPGPVFNSAITGGM